MSLRFKLDENLPRRATPALRALGHDVETTLLPRGAYSPGPARSKACFHDLMGRCQLDTRNLEARLLRQFQRALIGHPKCTGSAHSY